MERTEKKTKGRGRRRRRARKERGKKTSAPYWSLVVFIFLIVVSLYSVLNRGNDTQQDQVANDATYWENVPFEEPSYDGKPPTVPDLPHIPEGTDIRTARDPRSMVARIIRERLKRIIQAHPDQSISHGMWSVIDTDEVSFEFYTEVGMIASFGVWPAKFVISFENKEIKPGEQYPVFSFDPYLLARLSTSDQILSAMLVMEHEYEHYLKWKESEPRERATFLPRSATNKGDKPWECEMGWKEERRAYRIECERAVRWGSPDVSFPGLCRRILSDQAFDQYLFTHMRLGAPGRRTPKCVPIWARLVGHPNPDAFTP